MKSMGYGGVSYLLQVKSRRIIEKCRLQGSKKGEGDEKGGTKRVGREGAGLRKCRVCLLRMRAVTRGRGRGVSTWLGEGVFYRWYWIWETFLFWLQQLGEEGEEGDWWAREKQGLETGFL